MQSFQSINDFINYDQIIELTNPDVIKLLDISKCTNLRRFTCPSWFTDADMKKIRKLDFLELSNNDLVTEAGIEHLDFGCSRFPYGHLGRTYVYRKLNYSGISLSASEAEAVGFKSPNTSKNAQMNTVGNVLSDPEPIIPAELFKVDYSKNAQMSTIGCPDATICSEFTPEIKVNTNLIIDHIEQLIDERLLTSPVPPQKNILSDRVRRLLALKFTNIIGEIDDMVDDTNHFPDNLVASLSDHFFTARNHFNDKMIEAATECVTNYMTTMENKMIKINTVYNKFIDAIKGLNSQNKVLFLTFNIKEDSPENVVMYFFYVKFTKMGYNPQRNVMMISPPTIAFECDFSKKRK